MPLESPSDFDLFLDCADTTVVASTSTGIVLSQSYIDTLYYGDLGAALQALIDTVSESGGTIWIHQPIELSLDPDSGSTALLHLRSDVTLDFMNNQVELLSNVTLFEVKNCSRAAVLNVTIQVFEHHTGDYLLGSWIYNCLHPGTFYKECYDQYYTSCFAACDPEKADCHVTCSDEAAEACWCEDTLYVKCHDPANWVAIGGPCEGESTQCYQTMPLIRIVAVANEEVNFNKFVNINTNNWEQCGFYNIYFDVIQVENLGGLICGNVFSRVYCRGMGTGIHFLHDEASGETCMNAFDDCYFYKHVTMINFDVPDIEWPMQINANLFHHILGHSDPHFTEHVVRNITGTGNHFDKSWAWDYGNDENVPTGCEGRPDWTLLGPKGLGLDGARDTYILADYVYSICDSGVGTLLLTTPANCNLAEPCDCECVIDNEVGHRDGHWACEDPTVPIEMPWPS